MEAVLDTGARKLFISIEIEKKYLYYKMSQNVDINVLATANPTCKITVTLKLNVEVKTVKINWK